MRPTFQEYTAARNALRKKLPPGSAGDRMFHKMVGEACTTCHERHEKGKAVVRAYAALKAARVERGSRTAVVLKPAPSTSAVQSERDAPAPGPSVPSEREPAVPSERGGEERPDDPPKCPDGHVLEEDFVSGSEGYCDVCNGIFSRFANMMSCFQCQFYMCEGCYVKRKRAIREELKIDFRYTPEEERRPPAVVLSGRLASAPAVCRERGRVGTPAVPRERGEIPKRAAKAKAGGDPESEDEAPPPPRRGSQRPRLRVLLHLLQGGLRVAVLSLQGTKCLRETMVPKIYQVLGSRSHGVLGFVRSAAE